MSFQREICNYLALIGGGDSDVFTASEKFGPLGPPIFWTLPPPIFKIFLPPMDRAQPTLNKQTNHGLCAQAVKPLTFNWWNYMYIEKLATILLHI